MKMFDAPVIDHKQELDAELKRVVEKLGAREDVEAAIVYGSYASDEIGAESDLDLCVIQNTELKYLDERQLALEKFLAPRVPMDLTVYTPGEFLRFKRKWPFTRDQILGKGKILFTRDESLFAPAEPLSAEEEQQIMIESYRDWLTRAKQDLRAAEVLLPEEIWNLVCFHSQQTVEKCLKGLIVRRDHITPPREHTIDKLYTELPPEWFDDMTADLNYMSKFYTDTRYPNAVAGELPDHPVGKNDADRALNIAREVVARTEHFAKKIDDEQKNGL